MRPQEPSLRLRLPLQCNPEIRWLGDALLADLDDGTPVFRAVAVNETLVIELAAAYLGAPALVAGGQSVSTVNQRSVVDESDGVIVGDGYRIACRAKPAQSISWAQDDGGLEWRLSLSQAPAPERLVLSLLPLDGEDDPSSGVVDEALQPDISKAIAVAERWAASAPGIVGYPDLEDVWHYSWVLHRASSFEPTPVFPHVWETPGRGYLYHHFGHWDTVHTILDTVWSDSERATGLLINLLRLQDPFGRFGAIFNGAQEDVTHPLVESPSDHTTPPLWNYAALEVFRRTGSTELLETCYKAFARNIEWFETRRMFADTGLFYHTSMGETGYDNMPRGDFSGVQDMPAFSKYAAVDLSSQMVKYLRDMAAMALLIGRPSEATAWEQKAERLAEVIRNELWDGDRGFFFDLDTRTGELGAVRTLGGFWPMISGVADARQVERMVEHLTDPRKFWLKYPVPSVAADEELFALDCWCGPVWMSQNLWLIYGLQAYGFHDVAAQLSSRTMRLAADVLARDNHLYEFYNPFSQDVSSLKRKGLDTGPCTYYIGHNPVHAVLLAGHYGFRCGDQGLEICPQWAQIPEKSRLSFGFGESCNSLACYAQGGGLWRLTFDGTEVFRGSEGAPAIIAYEKLRHGSHEIEAVRG